MACRAWHGIWYGLARYCMVYDIAGRHDMVYGMAWRVMAWYIVWPGRHGRVYGKAWRGMAWYVQMLMWIYCLGLWSRSHVEKPMSVGGPVHTYRTHSQVKWLLHACSDHMYSSYSLWAVTVHWEIVNIYHCSEIEFLGKLILVIFIKVDVESSKYQNNISCLGTTKNELFRYVSVYNFRQWPLPSWEVQTEVKSRLSISVPKGQSCSKQTWIPIWQCPY